MHRNLFAIALILGLQGNLALGTKNEITLAKENEFSQTPLRSPPISKPDVEMGNECNKNLEWIPLSKMLRKDGNMDALLLGKEGSRNYYACQAEYNGKKYFGKGAFDRSETALLGREVDFVPHCWVVDGPFETLFRSGFSILKNPPIEKFNLEWKHFPNGTAATWNEAKLFLKENGALNSDPAGDGGFLATCRYEARITHNFIRENLNGAKEGRKKRFALKEKVGNYGPFIGFLNPAKPGEMTFPYGNLAFKCENFDFLVCKSTN